MRTNRFTLPTIALLATGLVAACGNAAEEADETAAEPTTETAMPEPASTEVAPMYAEELGVDLDAMTKTDSGLHYVVLAEGDGAEAAAGQSATVHYTGWLPNGTKFDSSRDRDQPFTFALGAGQVIPGWDEGVAGMKIGEQRKLVIPPALGYGTAGAGGVIPPNATLVFDVELLGAQ